MRGASLQKWKDCHDFGRVIMDTFLPFKTPLAKSANLGEEYNFTVESFLDYVNFNHIELGMVIDLTNTHRYYDPREFEHDGLLYFKLPCTGHIYFPSEEQVDLFIELVKKYKATFPNKLVGVHCTHGANRTGFMIVSYLVKELALDVEDAIEIFRQFRPPGIYRQTIIDELKERYGGANKSPAPSITTKEDLMDIDTGSNSDGIAPLITIDTGSKSEEIAPLINFGLSGDGEVPEQGELELDNKLGSLQLKEIMANNHDDSSSPFSSLGIGDETGDNKDGDALDWELVAEDDEETSEVPVGTLIDI